MVPSSSYSPLRYPKRREEFCRDNCVEDLFVHDFQKRCYSQLDRIAFTLRCRCEDARCQLYFHRGRSLSLRQNCCRFIECGLQQDDFVRLKYRSWCEHVRRLQRHSTNRRLQEGIWIRGLSV